MDRLGTVGVVIGMPALVLTTGATAVVWAAEPEESLGVTGQRVEVPELGIAVTWPEGWKIEQEPPVPMTEDPGRLVRPPLDLLGSDDVAWGDIAWAKGPTGECIIDLYEAPGLTLDGIIEWHEGLESPNEAVIYRAIEVERRDDLPAGEAVTITKEVEFFGTPTVNVSHWIDGGDAIAMLSCGGGLPAEELFAAATMIAPTIEFQAGDAE